MLDAKTLLLWVSILGSIASIVAIPVAIVQFIKLRRLNRERHRKTWTQISSVKAMMRHIEAGKMDSAYGLVCEQFRDLLKEAVLLEEDFSAATIKKWRNAGKLSSDWQEYQATQLLRTSEITTDTEFTEMETPLQNYDATPADHPVATAPKNPYRRREPESRNE